MRFDSKYRYLVTSVVSLFVVLALCLPGIPVTAAVGTTAVSVSGPAQPVSPGSQFTVTVSITPGSAIAGAQFNLAFTPSSASAVSVTEGNLLKQNGASTYFSTGLTNNAAGTITGAAAAITTPGQTVSTPGTMVTITMTAGSTRGTYPLTLSNVVVGDINGQSVPISVTSGQFSIDRAPVLSAIGNKNVNVTSTLTFVNSASDADGDALTYSASSLPAGATFTPATRTFSWTPSLGQVGSFVNVRFDVTDGLMTSSENITITVNKLTPVFSNLSAPSINYGVFPTSLSGTLKSGTWIPTGSISITLNGMTQTAAIDGSGNFSSSFDTGSLLPNGSPYSISYVYAGDANFNNVSDTSKTLTVNSIAVTVTLGSLSQTYNGAARTATATTSPPGLSVSFTYNGSSTAPTNAGSYTVVATVTTTGFSGSATGTLVIAKVTPVFSNLSSLSINYGAFPTSLSGTLKSGTLIPTGSVSITLNGVTQTAAIEGSGNFSSSFSTGTLPPGPYAISYVYAGDTNFNNVSDASRTLTVNSIPATVTLSSLSQTYSGTARNATATTSPSGLSVAFTYNGSSTAPTNAGSYTVVATVTTTGYSGSATGTLVVAKVTPAFSSLSAPGISYGVTPTSLSGNLKSGALIPTGSISITLNGVTQTAAMDGSGNFSSSFATGSLATSGSPYTISYVYAGDTNFNNVTDSSKTFTVSSLTATVTLGGLSQTYNGSPRSATATTNPTGLSVSFTYNGSGTPPTAAGSYTVVATVTTAGYSGSATGTLVIAKVTPAFSSLSAPSINYGITPTSLSGNIKLGTLIPTGSVWITLNGVSQSAVIDGSGNFSYSFGTGTLPPSGSPYTITYVYAGDTNFNNISDTSKTLTVNSIPATVTLGNLSQTYDGTAKSATASTNPTGLTVSLAYNGSSTAPTNAGNYTVVATVTSTGYSGSNIGTLVVARVTPVFSNLSSPGINYGVTPTSLSGSLKSGTLIPTGSVSITLNGVTQTAAIDGSGNFSSSFATGSLTASGSPYTISYVYAASTNFNAASDTSKTLTVVQPFAAWDVNMDRAVNVLDMISVSQHIGESGTPGWVKQDVNGDGVVSVLDLIITGQNWTG